MDIYSHLWIIAKLIVHNNLSCGSKDPQISGYSIFIDKLIKGEKPCSCYAQAKDSPFCPHSLRRGGRLNRGMITHLCFVGELISEERLVGCLFEVSWKKGNFLVEIHGSQRFVC